MALKHTDIWRAVDALAARHRLSPSGLAIKAGLSATAFNPAKRSAHGRRRWPSTESIARILQATGSSLNDFTALATPGGAVMAALPLLTLTDARNPDALTADGLPAAKTSKSRFRFPALPPAAFALAITGNAYAPIYRDGAVLIVAPGPAPRRHDRVVLRIEGSGLHCGIIVKRTPRSIALLDFAAPAKPVTLPTSTILWMHRILWASQ